MDIEIERLAFEAHWSDKYHAGHIRAQPDGSYTQADVQRAWEAWLARAERAEAAQRVPLADEQIARAAFDADWPVSMLNPAIKDKLRQFARAIEAKVSQQPAQGWISVEQRLPTECDGTVAVLLDDGAVLTAWATYWHGASREFACWTFPHADDEGSIVTHWHPLAATEGAQPLYAAPVAEAAQRVPLTEGQVQDAMRAADWPLSMLSPAIAAKLHQFARAIEAAHGIGCAARAADG